MDELLDANSAELPALSIKANPAALSRIRSKILFMRTISGLPLCSLCSAEAGHCKHTEIITNYSNSNSSQDSQDNLSRTDSIHSTRSRSSIEKLFAYSSKRISEIDLEKDLEINSTLTQDKPIQIDFTQENRYNLPNGKATDNDTNNDNNNSNTIKRTRSAGLSDDPNIIAPSKRAKTGNSAQSKPHSSRLAQQNHKANNNVNRKDSKNVLQSLAVANEISDDDYIISAENSIAPSASLPIEHQSSYQGIQASSSSHNSNNPANSSSPALGEYLREGYFVYCDKCDSVHECLLACYCVNCKHPVLPEAVPNSWQHCLHPYQIRTNCHTCGQKSGWSLILPKCSSCSSVAVPLTQIQLNPAETECVSCYCSEDLVINYHCNSSPQQSHLQCLECFKTYATLSVSERKLVLDRSTNTYTICCPLGCANSSLDSTVLRCLGSTIYNKYKRFSALNYTETSKIEWCPHSDCGNGFIARSSIKASENNSDSSSNSYNHNAGSSIVEPESKFLQCYACKRIYCKSCSKAPELHSKDGSSECSNSSELNEADLASLLNITESTRACPRCSVRIYKSAGCNHMRCVKCATEFCWIDGKVWNEECAAGHWEDSQWRTTALFYTHKAKRAVTNTANNIANSCIIM
jgi:hypothetical protein